MTEILSVDTSTALRERPRSARSERHVSPPADRATVEEFGTVKWYNAAAKGFGFIGPDQGGRDIFVHASVLARAGIADLPEGQRVAVDVPKAARDRRRPICA